MTHTRRAYPGRFRAIKRGERVHDFLRDVGFREGDRIIYQEWDPADDEATGDELAVSITAITRPPDDDVPRGYLAISFAPVLLPIHVPGDLAEERRRRDAAGTKNL